MKPCDILEQIFGTPWATPEQCASAAVLRGRQLYERDKPRLDLLRAHEAGDVMPVIWSQLAQTIFA